MITYLVKEVSRVIREGGDKFIAKSVYYFGKDKELASNAREIIKQHGGSGFLAMYEGTNLIVEDWFDKNSNNVEKNKIFPLKTKTERWKNEIFKWSCRNSEPNSIGFGGD